MSSAWMLFLALLLLSASVSAFYAFLLYLAEQRRIKEERLDRIRRWMVFVDRQEREHHRGVSYGLVFKNVLASVEVIAISQPLGCSPCNCDEEKHCTCGSRDHKHHHITKRECK